jgi:hypothetical protein
MNHPVKHGGAAECGQQDSPEIAKVHISPESPLNPKQPQPDTVDQQDRRHEIPHDPPVLGGDIRIESKRKCRQVRRKNQQQFHAEDEYPAVPEYPVSESSREGMEKFCG